MNTTDSITDSAADAVTNFANGPAMTAADDTAKLFEAAGERIARALDSAAKSGELSFNALAESVARDLAKMAVSQLITAPLSGAVNSITGSLFSGGAAPSGGAGLSAGRAPVTVNMTVNGVTDAASFNRSQGQISASLARAVASGQRFL